MFRLRYAALLLALPLHAGIVDLSSAETALVRTGDTLSFELSTRSYALNAQAFGLPVDPTDICIALLTAPLDLPYQFTATLSTPDASMEVAFAGPLGFTAGYLSSAGYQGAVSTLQGHLHLDPAQSPDLFANGSVWLNLLNTGADVTLGISPLFLRQDLFATLSGGPLSVGASLGQITLQTPSYVAFAGPASSFQQAVPEPGSRWLTVGGTLLCGFSALLQKLSGRRHRIDTESIHRS